MKPKLPLEYRGSQISNIRWQLINVAQVDAAARIERSPAFPLNDRLSALALPGRLLVGFHIRCSPPPCIPTPSKPFVRAPALARVIGSLPTSKASPCPSLFILLILTLIHSPWKVSLAWGSPDPVLSRFSSHVFNSCFPFLSMALSLNCRFPLAFF